MTRELLKWSAAGTLAGAALGLADGLLIIGGAAEMFFDSREMWRTAAWAVALAAAVWAGAFGSGTF